MYALNSYGETDKIRGTGTVVRGRIGKCQYGLQFGKDPIINKTKASTSIVTGDKTKKDPPTTEQDDDMPGPKIVALDAFRKN